MIKKLAILTCFGVAAVVYFCSIESASAQVYYTQPVVSGLRIDTGRVSVGIGNAGYYNPYYYPPGPAVIVAPRHYHHHAPPPPPHYAPGRGPYHHYGPPHHRHGGPPHRHGGHGHGRW